MQPISAGLATAPKTAIRLPSGLNVASPSSGGNPGMVKTARPVAVSHTLTVKS